MMVVKMIDYLVVVMADYSLVDLMAVDTSVVVFDTSVDTSVDLMAERKAANSVAMMAA
jgi:hypothetical protein